MDQSETEPRSYLESLNNLPPEKVEDLSKKWEQAGYFYAPLFVQTLQLLEEKIKEDTDQARVLLFDRDMYPFKTVKQVWRGNPDIDYQLIPASSAIFGKGPRNGIDMEASYMTKADWENNPSMTKEVGKIFDFTLHQRTDELVAFSRKLLNTFGIDDSEISSNQLIGLLKGELSSEEVFSDQRPDADYAVLFDCHVVGTFVELTNEMMSRLLPEVEVKAVMLDTYNPRIGCMTDRSLGSFGPFEQIPKAYDVTVEGEKISREWRDDPRKIWSRKFEKGLRVGVFDLERNHYQGTSPPDIDGEYVEKQWPGDFDQRLDKGLQFPIWNFKEFELGDFKKRVN
jgi:hypothetical protein